MGQDMGAARTRRKTYSLKKNLFDYLQFWMVFDLFILLLLLHDSENSLLVTCNRVCASYVIKFSNPKQKSH